VSSVPVLSRHAFPPLTSYAGRKTTGLLLTLEENPKWDLLREVLEEAATDADATGLGGGCADKAPGGDGAAGLLAAGAGATAGAATGAVVLVVARDDKTCRMLHEYVSREQKAVLQRELKWCVWVCGCVGVWVCGCVGCAYAPACACMRAVGGAAVKCVAFLLFFLTCNPPPSCTGCW
jgi:hypothetical protein